jgi:cytochrome P450
VHSLHQLYGSTVRLSPGEIGIADIDDIKAVYNLRETFVKSSFYTDVTVSSEPNMFNTSNVQYNRRLRRLLGGPMSESSIRSIEPTVVSLSTLAILRMEEEMNKRGAADVLKWWTFMATDVIGTLTFGESFRTLEQGKVSYPIYLLDAGLSTDCHFPRKPSTYTEDLAHVGPAAGLRATFPLLIPLTDYIPLPVLKAARDATNRITEYATDSVQRYQRLLDSDPTRAQHTLFTNVFKAEEEDTLTSDEVRNAAMTYIVAGTDTTANSLTYLIWSVCRHPEIKAALLEELKNLPRAYSDGDLRELRFLNYIIDETLRLYSAAPASLPRVVPPGGADLGAYWIPGGAVVSTQAYTMHRNPTIFPRPESFNPYRWNNATKDMRTHFMPFGRAGRSKSSWRLSRDKNTALTLWHSLHRNAPSLHGTSSWRSQILPQIS